MLLTESLFVSLGPPLVYGFSFHVPHTGDPQMIEYHSQSSSMLFLRIVLHSPYPLTLI